MSQVQAVQDVAVSERYSKRKRASVNYYEGGSDVEDLGAVNESQDVEECSQSKKRKSKRASRPLPKRKIFPFLSLPAEVRNEIYGYALKDPQGVGLVSVTEKYRRTVVRADVDHMRDGYYNEDQTESSHNPRQLAPSLLVVNRQIYDEGRNFLYENEFTFQDPLTLHSFLVNTGPRVASLLKSITISAWGGGRRSMHKGYNHACFAALISATNIEKVVINGWIGCAGGGKWAARQVYRDAFPFLESVGTAKGRFDAGVDIISVAEHNYERRGWYRRNGNDNNTPDQNEEEYKAELRKLLGAHIKRIRAGPAKNPKKDMDYEL